MLSPNDIVRLKRELQRESVRLRRLQSAARHLPDSHNVAMELQRQQRMVNKLQDQLLRANDAEPEPPTDTSSD